MKYAILFLFILIIPNTFTFTVKAESSTIFISEILPDGDGADAGKEWIELYNNSLDPLNIKDYFFINRSSSGTERKVMIAQSLILPPKQYFLISEAAQNITSENIIILGSGKINMYNDESDLELHDSDSAIVDSVHYPKPTEAKSLERKGPENILDCNKLVTNTNGNTLLTDNLNRDPACFGEAPVNNPTDGCLPISLLNSNLVNTAVCTTGYLSVEPDTLGEKTFYIEDGGIGIKVKLKDSPSILLRKGDKVQISGTLKSVKDGLYLYVDLFTLIGSNSEVFPTLLNNMEIQKYSLVEYTGEIVKNYSKSIDLVFNDSTIRVSVLASTNISMPTRTVGDSLKVTGVLVEEGGVFKILPRYQEDLEILEKEEPEIVQKTEVIKSTSVPINDSQAKVPSKISNEVINKLPSLSISKSPVPQDKLVKYSINRTWYLLLGLLLLVLLIVLINRNKIFEYLKRLKVIELKSFPNEQEGIQLLDFEKDKYELMFGNSS